MTTPTTNSYNSGVNLSLGQVPQVDDPELYRALLDIHNAIEILVTETDSDLESLTAFLIKFRNQAIVTDAAYTALPTDGVLLVDATDNSVTVTLHDVVGYIGYRLIVKRIDSVLANKVTLLGTGSQLIDGRAGGINVSSKSSYTVVATTNGWVII